MLENNTNTENTTDSLLKKASEIIPENMSDINFIGIENQYLLGAAVELNDTNHKKISFFKHEEDLVEYLSTSVVGFELPAVEINWTFSDQNLIQYLTEGSIIYIAIGKTMNSLKEGRFSVLTAEVSEQAQGKYYCHMVAVHKNIEFLKTPARNKFVGTSAEVAKQVLERAFLAPVIGRNVSSHDAQEWYQTAQSGYQFLYKLWTRSYTKDSLWLSAIDFEGKPRMISLRAEAKIAPEIMLSTGHGDPDSNLFHVLPDFQVRQETAVNNAVGVYTTSKPVFDLDILKSSVAQRLITPILSCSDFYNTAKGVFTQASHEITNENTHENYSIAPVNNKAMLLALKSLQLDVSQEGVFESCKLLDYVLFKDVLASSGQAQQDYSGIYMVGKIATQIVNKTLYTHLTLWRESFNTMQEAK